MHDAGIRDASRDALADAAHSDAQAHDAELDAFEGDSGDLDGGVSDAEIDAIVDAAEDAADAAVSDGGAPDGTVPLDELINVMHISPSATPIAPWTWCDVMTAETETSIQTHVTECSELSLRAHPPTQGEHYPYWAKFKAYDAPVPYGFLLHAMEHGAVVLWHNCLPSECPSLVASLRNIADTSDADPACSATDSRNRIIVVPDPTLSVPVAATAWQHTYAATCLDETSLRAFISTYHAQGPENLCATGIDRSALDGGWCP